MPLSLMDRIAAKTDRSGGADVCWPWLGAKNTWHCGMIGGAGCDYEWGHDGDMHANAGDGFYARQHDEEHHRRQAERAAPQRSVSR